MIEKEKALVYLFDIEFAPILRHKNLLSDYEIVGVVSLDAWLQSGRDAGDADGGPEMGMKIENDFDTMLPLCDTVIISETHKPVEFNGIILSNIEKAVHAGKNILYLGLLENEMEGRLLEICRQQGVYFKGTGQLSEDRHKRYIPSKEPDELHGLSTPVILVAGISEGVHKFEIQLALREHLQSMGYKVSQIGSRQYCELLGFHSFPEFMFQSAIPEDQKILLFSHLLSSIERDETPDVFILGLPGGTVPFNGKFTNKFGVLAYEISQAVTPDAVVLSLFYDDFNQEYYEKLLNLMKYRFGFEVDYLNISNVQFDFESLENSTQMPLLLFSSHFIDNKKQTVKSTVPLVNILNRPDAHKLACGLVDKLADYNEIQVL